LATIGGLCHARGIAASLLEKAIHQNFIFPRLPLTIVQMTFGMKLFDSVLMGMAAI